MIHLLFLFTKSHTVSYYSSECMKETKHISKQPDTSKAASLSNVFQVADKIHFLCNFYNTFILNINIYLNTSLMYPGSKHSSIILHTSFICSRPEISKTRNIKFALTKGVHNSPSVFLIGYIKPQQYQYIQYQYITIFPNHNISMILGFGK